MTLKTKCSRCRVAQLKAGCLFGCTKEERVMRELDLVAQGAVRQEDPIEEQLRRCPDAFKAGELVGKMCDQIKHGRNQTAGERHLPPAGAVMPPLV